MSPRLAHAVRRSWVWFAGVLVFVLLSIPAIFDLESLFRGLAVICGLLGLTTATYTYAEVRRSDGVTRSARRGPDEAAP
ncbi:MAG: hypothetical protein J7518_22260 [Nocardioidaceae bacterium]|nr:hypothetical protein [Nocardioidaceae bacterium]